MAWAPSTTKVPSRARTRLSSRSARMWAPCERVRSGNEAATLVHHNLIALIQRRFRPDAASAARIRWARAFARFNAVNFPLVRSCSC